MNKWIELLVGLVLVIGIVVFTFYSQYWGSWNFLSPAWTILKGAFVWIVLGVGILFILLGISDLKS